MDDMILYLLLGKLYKSIPNYAELNERLSELIVTSISINSGYTSMLKENPNSELKDQVQAFSLSGVCMSMSMPMYVYV